jgi:hypothetical protein
MNFVFTGKSREVFARIKQLADMAGRGEKIIYEGLRHKWDRTRIYILRTELTAEDISGLPATHVSFKELDPAPSQELWNHSPDGFEWGYAGSGPAQLALALLYDATGDRELSLKYYQPFKEAFVRRWGDNWQIRASEIIRWVGLKENYEVIKEQNGSL